MSLIQFLVERFISQRRAQAPMTQSVGQPEPVQQYDFGVGKRYEKLGSQWPARASMYGSAKPVAATFEDIAQEQTRIRKQSNYDFSI